MNITQDQINTLQILGDELRTNILNEGAAAPVYKFLINCISPQLAEALKWSDGDEIKKAIVIKAALDSIVDETVKDSATWLVGAIGVNNGGGLFASVIREYNVAQGQLRYGTTFSEQELNHASNEVGYLVAQQVILKNGLVPTVSQIGDADLNAVRDTLYNKNGDNLPNGELFLNQAWPGIVMLNTLGATHYVDRLLQTGLSDQSKTVDSAGDLKNLLFSFMAFESAYDKTKLLEATAADIAIGFTESPPVLSTVFVRYGRIAAVLPLFMGDRKAIKTSPTSLQFPILCDLFTLSHYANAQHVAGLLLSICLLTLRQKS